MQRPTAILSSSDTGVRRIKALLEALGEEIQARHDWTDLTKEQTFNTAAGDADYPLTDIFTDGDFKRLKKETDWDSTNNRRLTQVTSSEWQYLKNSVGASTGTNKRIYRRGGILYIDPTPTATETLLVEYISKNWRTSSSGTGKAAFTLDTDTTVWDENLVEAGLEARLKRSYRVPYADEENYFQQMLDDYVAADTPKRVLQPTGSIRRDFVNVPDTGAGL